MIKRWHYCIMGFTQTVAQPTGVENLWLEMRDLASADASFQLRPWDANWQLEAGFINRCSDPNPLISIYAYSWGVGNGFVKMTCELGKLSQAVRMAVLCDPIDHDTLNPLKALDHNVKVQVPENVGEVWWCYQKNDPYLRGQTPIAPDTTIIHPGVEIPDAVHVTIQDSAWFHDKAMEMATWIESQKPS